MKSCFRGHPLEIRQFQTVCLQKRSNFCGPPHQFPRSAKHSRRGSEGFPAEKTVACMQNLSPVFSGSTSSNQTVCLQHRANRGVTRLLLLLGSRHTTRPTHAGVGGHHTTVSSLFFIAYPQTRVPAPSMLGPYADATGQSLNPLFDCSKPGPLKSTNPYPISRDLDLGMSPLTRGFAGPPATFRRAAKHSRRGREGFPAEKTVSVMQNLSPVFRGHPPEIRQFDSKTGKNLRSPPMLSEGRKTLTPRA